MQKIILLLAFYALSIHSMDTPLTKEIILNTLHQQITFHSILPVEINQKICRYTCLESSAKNLNAAGKIISILTQTNKPLKELFSNSENCLFIIKKLSARFDCSNEKIAETLCIQAARQRYYLQNTFQLFCYSPCYNTSISKIAKLKHDNVDFNFTYGNLCITCSMMIFSPADPRPNIGKYLILNGADLHLECKDGYSTYSKIFQFHPYLIPFLVEHKKLEPNKMDDHHRTPLINLMIGLNSFYHSQKDIQIIENGMRILLEVGTDPELAHKDGRRPLDFARQVINKYPQFITLLEEAIAKKHAAQ